MIRALQIKSQAKIQVAKACIPGSNLRNVFIEGPPDKYEQARLLINAIIEEQKRMTASYKAYLTEEISPTLANSNYVGLFPESSPQVKQEVDFNP